MSARGPTSRYQGSTFERTSGPHRASKSRGSRISPSAELGWMRSFRVGVTTIRGEAERLVGTRRRGAEEEIHRRRPRRRTRDAKRAKPRWRARVGFSVRGEPANVETDQSRSRNRRNRSVQSTRVADLRVRPRVPRVCVALLSPARAACGLDQGDADSLAPPPQQQRGRCA